MMSLGGKGSGYSSVTLLESSTTIPFVGSSLRVWMIFLGSFPMADVAKIYEYFDSFLIEIVFGILFSDRSKTSPDLEENSVRTTWETSKRLFCSNLTARFALIHP